MKIDLTAIDLDAIADLDVFIVVVAVMLAFGIFMLVRFDMKRLRISASPDPFFYPIGEVPNLPKLPAGSILEGAEAGAGYTPRELYLIERSARRAAPAGQGSGGNGNTSRGPVAAGPASPSSWRGNRAR
jgi:hypothetical protein